MRKMTANSVKLLWPFYHKKGYKIWNFKVFSPFHARLRRVSEIVFTKVQKSKGMNYELLSQIYMD